MNSFINVQIRVLVGQARQQMAQLNQQIQGMGGSFTRATGASAGFMSSLGGNQLVAFGSRVQWVGRQLEYNFTLPIIAASAAAFKLALDNESAFTRIVKVYGDATHGADFYAQELKSLQGAFEALSNTFGIAQKDTLNIAADWAAAGASGLALAKSVELTMKTMILGELGAADATKALISIQAQYGLSIDELTKTIAILNMTENQTGISMAGLIDGFSRAAGVARSAGVDTRHLAAMLAALTPAAGSAAQAGNALKTIFSRLLAPTKDTQEVLGLIGIDMSSVGWQSSNLTDRLGILATKFEELSGGQQGFVSSIVASRWQINKFEVLMRELTSDTGYYKKALDSTADSQAVFTQMQRELNTVLESNPRRLQIIWTMLQNAAADIITPMIPLLLYLAHALQSAVTWFSNLNPAVQKMILLGLGLLAVLGPVTRLFGAISLAVGSLGKFIGFLLIPFGKIKQLIPWLLRLAPALVSALAGPWGIALGVVVTLVIVFWDDIVKAFYAGVRAVQNGFNKLPEGVRNAMLGVIHVLQSAIIQVIHLLSYLNPWARHSPSLVDNVTTGVAEIIRQYALLGNVGRIFSRAGVSLQAFGQSMANAFKVGDTGQWDKLRADIEEFAPNLIGDFNNLFDTLQSLRKEMTDFGAAFPVERAKELSDAIFQNEMATKALQLQMMNLEDATGPMDELQNKINDINGALEMLNGERAGLRAAGAGSDILSQYDEQIKALDEQKAAIEEQLIPIKNVSDQLEALRREAERLQLTQALEFDPLTRQADELTAAIRDVEAALGDMAQAAAAAQAATSSASGNASNFADAAAANFPDVGGTGQIGREGDFADQSALIDEYTKNLAQQMSDAFGSFDLFSPIKDAWNKVVDWLKEHIGPGLKSVFGGLGDWWDSLDFGPIIDKAKEFWDMLVSGWNTLWELIGPPIKEIGKIIKDEFGKAFEKIAPEIEKFKEMWPDVKVILEELWKILKPVAIVIGVILIGAITVLAYVISHVLGPVLDWVIGTLAALIKIFRGIIEFLVGAWSFDWGMMWQGVKDILQGNWDLIVAIVKGALGVVWGLLSGIADALEALWNKLWDEYLHVIGDTWNSIVDAIRNGISDAWNWIQNVGTSIGNFFSDLWDRVWNGVQGLMNNFEGFIGYIQGLPGRIAGAIGGLFSGLWPGFRNTMNQIIGAWNRLSFTIGGGDFMGIPIPSHTFNAWQIPYLAKGGMIDKETLAVIGEAGKQYPEFVIPTDPSHRDRALQLFTELGSRLGARQNGEIGGSGASGFGNKRVIVINGDLSFPNVKDGKDVEEFLRNLEALMGEA